MNNKKIHKGIRGSYRLVIVICALLLITTVCGVYFFIEQNNDVDEIDTHEANLHRIENGIHMKTGFIVAPGMQETIANCTSCHSAQLVIQNRMNAAQWKTTIDWMQNTQGLWHLGSNETVIIDYLSKNYPPSSKGRREVLTNVVWYELKE